jgi:phytoene desaturase
MYAGVSPQEALALYAVIAYMDSVNGVFFPKGGMHAVPRALAEAATKHGVEFLYNTTVSAIEKSGGKATAVLTSDGQRIECDALILTPDLPVAWRELLGGTPKRIERLKYSPSCVTLLVGSSKHYDHIAHHNIHFGESWDGVFDELINKKVVMSDPSLLVTVPTHDDPELAPEGKVLEARGYTDIAGSIETLTMTTPLEWQAMGLERGAPFASAHTFLQTGPFRPSNVAKGYENIFFAGSGTQPGVGVPMVLISGRLAAERILGRVK